MKKLVLSLSTVALLATSANAGKNVELPPSEPIPVVLPLGLYFGGGLTYAHSKCKCNSSVRFSDGSSNNSNSGSSYGFNLKAGYTIIDKYLSVEAKYIYNTWGDDYKGIKHYGLYLKPTYPITDHIDIYALLGYGKTECEALNKSESSFAWGAGAEYTFKPKKAGRKEGLGVYVEYLRPLKKTGDIQKTVDLVNAGISYSF